MTNPLTRSPWGLLLAVAGVGLLVVLAVALWPDPTERGGAGDGTQGVAGAETPTGRSTDTPTGPPGPADLVVIAHRGASAYAPHDTVAAAKQAVSRGADVLEADIRQTRDGHLVALFHATLAPTTDVEEVYPERAPWRVEEFTLSEIRRLDAGSWFGPEFRGERVPTLAELADALEGSEVELMVEVKSPQRYPGVADRVLREIRSHPGRYREMESFDWEFVRRFAQLSPPVKLGAAGAPPAAELEDVASYADAVNPALGAIDAGYVNRAHELGLEVKVWSLNEPALVRRALSLGVDGIYSHRPDMVYDVLEE
jgi:glycerophosphoryl diester phosphodiesterase